MMMIGWRGEKGKSDEKKKMIKGKIKYKILEKLGIKF